MLRELVNEIIELLNESDAKDVRITELENENAKLKSNLEIANDLISQLNLEVTSLNNNIVEKENNIRELETNVSTCENRINVLEGDISNLQVQADLKLDEVKNIVGDLKELIANA